MIAVAALLQHLTRPEVTEVCLRSDARPFALVGAAPEDLGAEALSPDDLLHALFATGGSRYVDALGPKPSQWRTRVEGVGAVVVSAAMNGTVLEARFALRDAVAPSTAAAPPPPAAPPPAPPAPPPPLQAPARPRPPSTHPVKGGPRSMRTRPEGVPSSRRPKPGRNGRPRGFLDEPTPTPGAAEDERPHAMPTPPRGFVRPRAAMPSNLELDLEVEIPSVPNATRPARAEPPPFRPPTARPQVPATPSVPPVVVTHARVPVFDDAPSGPLSPRTLPESGFGLDEEPAPQVRWPATSVDAAYAPRSVPPDGPVAGRAQVATIAGTGVELRSRTPPERPRASPLDTLAPEAIGRSPSNSRAGEHDAHQSIFRKLLREARELSASDLHLVGGRPPLMRVAGQLVAQGEPLHPGLVEGMILSRVPRRLQEVFERDGSCDFAIEERDLGRFRVNVSRHRVGIKASLRLSTLHIPTLPMLGLPDVIGMATRYHQGLIVLTGPTGHGKTTTLAALVDILNTESTRHIITVEDPIEHVHPRKRAMMSQREVGTHTRSFQTALKAALREDPDVIVVGELRDTETVRIALAASETGHLVLGTMSTPSAAKAIDRLIDLFPPADQQQVRMTLAGGLRLIVSQRLLPDVDGRAMVAAVEVLPGILPLWNLIRDNRTYQIPSLQQRGRELGVIRLDDSLRDLVRAGKVTPAAAVAVAESPEELEQVLGIRRGSVVIRGAAAGSAAAPRRRARAAPPSPSACPRPPPPRGASSTASSRRVAERPCGSTRSSTTSWPRAAAISTWASATLPCSAAAASSSRSARPSSTRPRWRTSSSRSSPPTSAPASSPTSISTSPTPTRTGPASAPTTSTRRPGSPPSSAPSRAACSPWRSWAAPR